MDVTLRDLLARLDRVSGELTELRDGVKRAVAIAEVDPDMALTRARKVLEIIVRDLFWKRVGEDAGTRPLENLLQRLVKDGHVPKRLAAYANAVRELGNIGAHGFGESVTTSDVVQSLSQLTIFLEWYFEHERLAGEKALAPADNLPDPHSSGPRQGDGPPRSASADRRPRRRRVGWLIGLAVLAAGAAGGGWWFMRPPATPDGRDSRAKAEPSHGSDQGDTVRAGRPPSTQAAPQTVAAPAPEAPPAADLSGPKFQAFKSEAGRFSVEMPGEPEETTQHVGAENEQHTFAVVLPGPTVFRIQYTDLAAAAATERKNAQTVLKLYRGGCRQGATFEGDRQIALGKDETPGREYSLESEKGVFVRERLYLSGGRVYTLHVVSAGDKDFLTSNEADRFFESFQITP